LFTGLLELPRRRFPIEIILLWLLPNFLSPRGK